MSEYNIGNNAIDKAYLKLMAGSFHSGDAYAPNGDDRNAFRFIAELEFRF
mgnify:CR=1 FL=1